MISVDMGIARDEDVYPYMYIYIYTHACACEIAGGCNAPNIINMPEPGHVGFDANSCISESAVCSALLPQLGSMLSKFLPLPGQVAKCTKPLTQGLVVPNLKETRITCRGLAEVHGMIVRV